MPFDALKRAKHHRHHQAEAEARRCWCYDRSSWAVTKAAASGGSAADVVCRAASWTSLGVGHEAVDGDHGQQGGDEGQEEVEGHATGDDRDVVDFTWARSA